MGVEETGIEADGGELQTDRGINKRESKGVNLLNRSA